MLYRECQCLRFLNSTLRQVAPMPLVEQATADISSTSPTALNSMSPNHIQTLNLIPFLLSNSGDKSRLTDPAQSHIHLYSISLAEHQIACFLFRFYISERRIAICIPSRHQ